MTRPADTTIEAWAIQRAIFRGMRGPERVAMAFEMSEAARALSEAGIRQRHPEWDDERVHHALLTTLLGSETADKVRRARQRRSPSPA